MSDEPSFDYDPDESEEQEGPDPALVAFLDQETEQFNNSTDSFEHIFGFAHHCTCAQDYTEGRLAETTHCFGRLCQDAMDACKKLKEENDFLIGLVRGALNGKDAS